MNNKGGPCQLYYTLIMNLNGKPRTIRYTHEENQHYKEKDSLPLKREKKQKLMIMGYHDRHSKETKEIKSVDIDQRPNVCRFKYLMKAIHPYHPTSFTSFLPISS